MSGAGLAARRAALDALAQVLDRRRSLDEAVAGLPKMDGPEADTRDRAFAHLLVATTLRRLGQTDALIDRCLDRPLPPSAGRIRHLLRLGAAQILFLDTPPHAAVSTAVDLSRETARGKFAGLVNGILRRLDREGRAWRDAQDAPRLNTPDWLWTGWTACYGEETTRRIAQAHLTEAPLDLSVPRDAEDWAARLGGTLLSTGTLRLAPGGRVTALAGFSEGAWWVQDAAAALPARLLGNVAGRRMLDLCAAPGGKTAQLAAAGAQVTALDRSVPRLERLRENLDRLGFAVDCVEADAAAWSPETPFDAVLLDAPCTATGTLRRHPDAAHLKSAEEVSKLAAVQDRLLRSAAEMVRPGGVLVYCTCSLQPEEGPRRIEALLANSPGLRRDPVRAHEIGGAAEWISGQGDLRTLPCHLPDLGGLDGFYAARLLRTG